jgi:hypothetical protein
VNHHQPTHQSAVNCRFQKAAPNDALHPRRRLRYLRPGAQSRKRLSKSTSTVRLTHSRCRHAPNQGTLRATHRRGRLVAAASSKPHREASSWRRARTLRGVPAVEDGPVTVDGVPVDRVCPRGSRCHPRPPLKLLWGTVSIPSPRLCRTPFSGSLRAQAGV